MKEILSIILNNIADNKDAIEIVETEKENHIDFNVKAVSYTHLDVYKRQAVESADNVIVPVPKGYTASSVTTENKVSEGFVIYEGEEEVTDTNSPTARTTRNQCVWVPVANPSEMYGTDSSGKKWGKLYNFSSWFPLLPGPTEFLLPSLDQ